MHIDGPWIKDEAGRTLILRGVNLGGSSKVPYRPDGATYIREGFFDHRRVSFVGRPFPIEEADEHFTRLREWGLTFLRFLITWEAVEHEGPGIYDQEYLDYVRAVVEKAGEYGISLFIDPHQDVWSRFSGGDGAPGWTFEAVGLDIKRFAATGAAIVHAVHGDPFPRMIWPTNGNKMAAATMFTLFFGGNDFAPETKVDGEPVQEFLQRHYIEAVKQMALRLKDLPNVVGYDTLNEPLSGYIGLPDLRSWGKILAIGETPTPFEGMMLGAGFTRDIGVWDRRVTGPKLLGRKRMNPEGVSAWMDGYDCVWRQNGLWDVGPDGAPRLLRPDYFSVRNGRPVDFNHDYLRPFANRFAREIRAVSPNALIFVETEPNMPSPCWGPNDAPNVVYAQHWYDGYVLFLKSFNRFLAVDVDTEKPVIGPGRIRKSFARQVGALKKQAAERMGGVPTLVGEFGIAYDLQKKKAYRTGDFRPQVQAINRSFRAMEDNLMNCTLWNYTSDNSNLRGDQWNDEDLSIFSRDQQHDPSDINSGGRALAAVVRPYAAATAGEPLLMSFDIRRREFIFEFRHDASVAAPTEFFVPRSQYPNGYAVDVSDGRYETDPGSQRLSYHHGTDRDVHRIVIRPLLQEGRPSRTPSFRK